MSINTSMVISNSRIILLRTERMTKADWAVKDRLFIISCIKLASLAYEVFSNITFDLHRILFFSADLHVFFCQRQRIRAWIMSNQPSRRPRKGEPLQMGVLILRNNVSEYLTVIRGVWEYIRPKFRGVCELASNLSGQRRKEKDICNPLVWTSHWLSRSIANSLLEQSCSWPNYSLTCHLCFSKR